MSDDAPNILVDADACPVKDEVYTVAGRHGLNVVLVANSYMRIPRAPTIRLEVVSDSFDAADDWIAEHATARSVVVTADILLAERCLQKGSLVISNSGKRYTENSIGSQVATRALMQDLRGSVGGKNDMALQGVGGPPPFSKQDRSRFLSSLHEAVEKLKRD